MPRKLLIAFEVTDNRLANVLQQKLEAFPSVKVTRWFDATGEKGTIAVKTAPDIIVLEDVSDKGHSIFQRLGTLRENFPQAAMFVVSANQYPQHIVQVMKAGVAEYLVTPINDKVLQSAVEEVRSRLSTAGQIAKGSAYSFISSKGGLGSTVIAVNTACALARKKDKRTALFDMSFQSGDATVLLDLFPQTTITDIVNNYHRLDSAFLAAAMAKHSSGLEFLAAPNDPGDRETITAEHVASLLDLAKKIYDHIIVDCTSMAINDCSIEAFRASEKIFLVTDMSVPAIRNCARGIKLIRKFDILPENIEIVINRFIKGGALTISEVEKTLGKKVFWLFPNDFKGVVSSINKGTPLLSGSSGAPLSKNILQFVEKITNPGGSQAFRGIRGVFGKAI
jgi:pilus assembly protein CpaE